MPPFTLRRRRRIVHAASIRHRSTYAVDVSSMPPSIRHRSTYADIVDSWARSDALSSPGSMFDARNITAFHSSQHFSPAQPQYLTAASTATVPHSSQHSHSTSQQPAQPVPHSSQHFKAVQHSSTTQQPSQHSTAGFPPTPAPLSPPAFALRVLSQPAGFPDATCFF